MRTARILTALLVSFLLSATASAQVFDPGPSDPALFTNVINLPGDNEPSGSVGGVVGETTQVNVADGGSVGFGFYANSASEINISGGDVGDFFNAEDGSEVNISGGSVGSRFQARDGSVINISGGSVEFIDVRDGSVVNMSAGDIDSFTARDGSEVSISGGALGSRFFANEGSDVELVGGEYKLNGEAFLGPSITLGANDVFTGTLADGSAFIFGSESLSGVSLTSPSEPLPEASLIPIVVATPVGSWLQGLREGQSLTLQTGGELGRNFAVVEATLNVDGGAVDDGIEVARGIVNIVSGTVGEDFRAFAGSVVSISGGDVGRSFGADNGSLVNISGGNVADRFVARSGSVVNISGGSVGDDFIAGGGSEINITGGSVESAFDACIGSVVNISGGTIGDDFDAYDDSNVNLFGSDFVLDGVPVDDLILGEAFTILDRDVTLSGLLTDGSAFSFDLNSDFAISQDQFTPGAILTVTLVPELLLGDCNLDGVVDFADIPAFIQILLAGELQAEADVDQNDVVNFADIPAFIQILLAS